MDRRTSSRAPPSRPCTPSGSSRSSPGSSSPSSRGIGAWLVAAWLAGIIVEPADRPRLLRHRAARLRAARRRASPWRGSPSRYAPGPRRRAAMTAAHERARCRCGWCGDRHRRRPARRRARPWRGAAARPRPGPGRRRTWPTPRAGWRRRLGRAAHRPPFDLTTFPNDEGYNELVLATAHPGAVAVRAPPAAVHRGRAHRLPARRAHPRACPSSPACSSCSPATCRCRSGSPSRSPTGCRSTSPRAGSAWSIEAEHLCMSLRGVRATGARTITSALHGVAPRATPDPARSSSPWPGRGLA